VARASQTEAAVLGVLSVQSMTGYAVREAIRDVLGHFWSESFGQIYPTLAQLEQDGLVERSHGERAGSSVYGITAAGRDRLVELLSQPDRPAPARSGLMLRLFFGNALGVEACRDLIRQARVTAEGQLKTFQALRDELASEAATREHHPYWLLTISAGEHTARAALAWADESLDALAALEPDEPRAPDANA
jgi:DNA-binding PadR family transcriptional regulator